MLVRFHSKTPSFHPMGGTAAQAAPPSSSPAPPAPFPRTRKKLEKTQIASESPSNSPVTVDEVIPDIEDFKADEASSISAHLLHWYDTNHRVLPWRSKSQNQDAEEDDKAYAVWVSEVMLQQTRVAAVVDYYNRWMEKWPTLHHLARASQEEVNDMWAGLGYYRRARYLLEGAKEIVENQGGVFPRSVETLKKVPGIGNYTAGAIASIAFKQAVPVVDGNVIRVICRLKAISVNPKLFTTIKRLWELAGQLVDPKRPGDLNQAIMELGATICIPRSPKCSTCPLTEHCNALGIVRTYNSKKEQQSLSTEQNAEETVKVPSVTDYPIKVLKATPREEFAAVCVIEMSPESTTKNISKTSSDRNSFLIVQRPQQGLLAGLWEFPSVLVGGSNLSLVERNAAMDQYLENSLGVQTNHEKCNVILRESVGQHIHVFSHIRLHMYVEWMLVHMPDGLDGLKENEGSTSTYKDGLKENEGLTSTVMKWVDKKSIESMGLTSGVRKVYTMIEHFKHGTGEFTNKGQKAHGTGKSTNKRQKQIQDFFH